VVKRAPIRGAALRSSLAGAAVMAVLSAGCGQQSEPAATSAPAPLPAPAPAAAAPARTVPMPATAATAAPPASTGGASFGNTPTGPPKTLGASTVAEPSIVQRPIPFGARRRAEMIAYARRHYGSFMAPTYRLVNPQVIVEHFTETATFSEAYNTFASDAPDVELHETPGTCAHFVIDTDGTIYQLVSTSIMCRHTVGLNWTAVGIEHVAFSDQAVLGNGRQMASSIALTCWLASRFHIALNNVIGHNESLSSPFHHEDVAALRTQTHNDWARPAMQIYRARLRRSCLS
jgi:N-acetylmuramoyl-L-alanine amidase